MSVDVAAIRARLEALRDLPWSWRVTDDRRWAVVEDANGDRRAQVNDDDVAEFIAHAPADVAALLAEVERLNMTAGVLRSHLESLWEELFENAAVSHEARMKRALGVLRSALEGEQDFVNAFEQVREDRARAEAERDALAQRLARVAERAATKVYADDVSRLTAELEAAVERGDAAARERDEWKSRRDHAVEECRFLHQEGMSRRDHHLKHCGAARAAREAEAALEAERAKVARVEALLADLDSCPGAAGDWDTGSAAYEIRRALGGHDA